MQPKSIPPCLLMTGSAEGRVTMREVFRKNKNPMKFIDLHTMKPFSSIGTNIEALKQAHLNLFSFWVIDYYALHTRLQQFIDFMEQHKLGRPSNPASLIVVYTECIHATTTENLRLKLEQFKKKQQDKGNQNGIYLVDALLEKLPESFLSYEKTPSNEILNFIERRVAEKATFGSDQVEMNMHNSQQGWYLEITIKRSWPNTKIEFYHNPQESYTQPSGMPYDAYYVNQEVLFPLVERTILVPSQNVATFQVFEDGRLIGGCTISGGK